MNAHNEIVGARIGSLITNNPEEIAPALAAGKLSEWLTRSRMQMMGDCNADPRWIAMANSPTLFFIDNDGHAHPVKDE